MLPCGAHGAHARSCHTATALECKRNFSHSFPDEQRDVTQGKICAGNAHSDTYSYTTTMYISLTCLNRGRTENHTDQVEAPRCVSAQPPTPPPPHHHSRPHGPKVNFTCECAELCTRAAFKRATVSVSFAGAVRAFRYSDAPLCFALLARARAFHVDFARAGLYLCTVFGGAQSVCTLHGCHTMQSAGSGSFYGALLSVQCVLT